MTVTVTNVMSAACMGSNNGAANTTFMFRRRPKHRPVDALRRVILFVVGLLLAVALILWFMITNAKGDETQ